MAETKSVTMTFAYKDTDFTRKYKLEDVGKSAAEVKTAIKGINASLSAGTDGGLSTTFVSDDFDSEAGVGTFASIAAAQFDVTDTKLIDLSESE